MRTRRFLLGAAVAAIVITATAPAVHADDMLYLARGSFIDPGVMMPMEQRVKLLNELVFPSFEKLVEWEKAGKMMGGLPVGAREGYLIFKAPSNEAADRMLHELPFWGVLEWEVIPLGSFADRLALERGMMPKPAGSKGQ